MDIAGVVLAVLSEGDRLVALVITLKDARSEIEDRVAKIQSHWVRTQAQLDFARRAWIGLSKDHRTIQLSTLKRLQSKVESAEHRIQGLISKQTRATATPDQKLKIKRMKYLFVKPCLDSVIDDLVQWQTLYDPTFYLMMKIASPIIDAELQRKDPGASREATAVLRSARKVRSVLSKGDGEDTHVFLPSDGLEGTKTSRISYSKATLASRSDSSTPYLVDSIPCPSYAYAGIMTKDIRRLASKLRAVDPATFGMLKCLGVVKWPPKSNGRITSFEMIFETPSTHKPRTLRKNLITQQHHSLTDRVNIAKRLASSVNFVHTLDFVHKSIRPENLISFESATSSNIGSFHLIGFEQVRSEDGRTYLRGSENWEQNIYKHPNRQGAHLEERYSMQHDIYSLGVCLLEIGLWSSFVKYGDGDVVLGPGDVLGLTSSDLCQATPISMKHHLVELAKSRLPAALGNVYTEVVLSCLTCLDADSEDFEEIVDDEDVDGVFVGVKFIERVLFKLNEINV